MPRRETFHVMRLKEVIQEHKIKTQNNPLYHICTVCNVEAKNGIPRLAYRTFKSNELNYQYCAEPTQRICTSCWNKLKPVDEKFFNYQLTVKTVNKLKRELTYVNKTTKQI